MIFPVDKIDALDRTALKLAGSGIGNSHVARAEWDETIGAAVVADIDRAVGPDRSAVRSSRDVRHDFDPSVYAVKRESVSFLMSTKSTDPSAIATGPSGKPRPSATTSKSSDILALL